MSGESSGWACEVPTELSDNTEVSKIHFFNMTTPFAMFPAPIIRWWGLRGRFTVHTADRSDVRVN
jgi:hypothetical protein